MKMRLAAGGALLLLTSCVTPTPSTHVKTVWKDPAYHPQRFSRALVIGVYPNLDRRRLFEEAFSKALNKYADKTIPSYTVLPDIAAADRAKVEALVKEQQIDAVFITRLLEKTTTQIEIPGHTTEISASPLDGAVSYFNAGKEEVTSPSYTVDQTVAVLETKLFDASTGTCLWTCRSDTLMNGYLDDLIVEFATVMTQSLFPPAP